MHRLGLSQRENKECADLRYAMHFASVYTHTRNARDYEVYILPHLKDYVL